MWPGRSRRPPAPDPPPIADDSGAHSGDRLAQQQSRDSDGEEEDDDDDGAPMLESENMVAVVATPRPHAPVNGSSNADQPIASGLKNEMAATSSSSTTGDFVRKIVDKSRAKLIFECGDDRVALAARLKGRKFSTPENYISHGPMMSRRKGPSGGGSTFTDLVEEEEGCPVGGFRRTVSTSALRLQNRSLFWKALTHSYEGDAAPVWGWENDRWSIVSISEASLDRALIESVDRRWAMARDRLAVVSSETDGGREGPSVSGWVTPNRRRSRAPSNIQQRSDFALCSAWPRSPLIDCCSPIVVVVGFNGWRRRRPNGPSRLFLRPGRVIAAALNARAPVVTLIAPTFRVQFLEPVGHSAAVLVDSSSRLADASFCLRQCRRNERKLPHTEVASESTLEERRVSGLLVGWLDPLVVSMNWLRRAARVFDTTDAPVHSNHNRSCVSDAASNALPASSPPPLIL
uniref:Uncharacterized protein n=1 Tax=Plectus sambesii TaxID=2011161 RepID=A0A914VJU4_9BILA